MSAVDNLILYIKSLTQEQAEDAKEFICSWLSKQPEAQLRPLQKECEQIQ